MGLFLYLFDYKEWSRLYKDNCSIKSIEEWNAEGPPNIPIGILYIFIGVICEVLYIPFMIVMLRHEFIQHSCYKFMFLLGIIDMVVLPFNSIMSGIQCMFGYHYCTNPDFYYVIGVIPTSGWYGAGMTCILLAINRFFEMLAPRISKILFSGKRIYFWLAIPMLYTIFTFSQESGIYNTKYYAFNYPFFGEEGWEINENVNKIFHCVHNSSVVIIIGGIYGILCIFIGIKSKSKMFKSAHFSKMQKLMTLQSMFICLEMFVAAIVYVFNQFIPLPGLLLVIAHACWICVHGDTPIVYLVLNKTLRRAVFELVNNISERLTKNTVRIFKISPTQESRSRSRSQERSRRRSGQNSSPNRSSHRHRSVEDRSMADRENVYWIGQN